MRPTTAAARPQRDFEGIFGQETSERFLHGSYDQLASHSTVPNCLPLLAERSPGPRPARRARRSRSTVLSTEEC
ncbi:hypothetical protein [Lentzea alba]|uniref:hypothetical protein n=1 Tax=Lentzea alba TaxID=2714351 RepID=UPI0036F2D21C